MKFCSQCGQPNHVAVPDGDNRERRICSSCGTIHYQNPRMVVGCIVEQQGAILLCKRAIEPRHGYWTVPAGYLELGESAVEGAVRETREEAQAEVEVTAPYSHFDVPHIGQAYLMYRARMRAPTFGPGPESLAVQWFQPEAIPWDDLAFHAVGYCLRLFCEDLQAQRFRQHHGVVTRRDDGYFLEQHIATTLAD